MWLIVFFFLLLLLLLLLSSSWTFLKCVTVRRNRLLFYFVAQLEHLSDPILVAGAQEGPVIKIQFGPDRKYINASGGVFISTHIYREKRWWLFASILILFFCSLVDSWFIVVLETFAFLLRKKVVRKCGVISGIIYHMCVLVLASSENLKSKTLVIVFQRWIIHNSYCWSWDLWLLHTRIAGA